MGKNHKRSKRVAPSESNLILPKHPAETDDMRLVDTHTHVHSTFLSYRKAYPDSAYKSVFDFARGV